MATDKLVEIDHVKDFISRDEAIALKLLENVPAADVRPVVRARWKAHGDCGVT